MEQIMKKTILFVADGVMFTRCASAAPLLNQRTAISQPTNLENVRLVCREDGHCYRTNGRRYVERRYYDDSYAYGPRRGYVEPGYGYGYVCSEPGFHRRVPR